MCPVAMLARAGLLLCLVVGSRQLSITELLVPNAVRLGESVELICRFDRGEVSEESLSVKWWWKSFNNNADPEQIFQRIGTAKGSHMHNASIEEKDKDTVVLKNAQPEDSGTYECEVSSLEAIQELRKDQNLTVFSPGTGPQLNISRVADGPDEDTEEDVLVECRADKVAPSPLIMIKINGEEYINITEEIIGPYDNGYYDALGTVTLTEADVDGATVECELTYSDATISHAPFVVTQDYTSDGDSRASRASWALLFTLSLLTQIPSLF